MLQASLPSGGPDRLTVDMLDSSNTVVLRSRTDATGFYFFDNTSVLSPGANYTVRVTIPRSLTTSTPASQTFTWAGTAIALANFVLN